jgi:hypothetical protein
MSTAYATANAGASAMSTANACAMTKDKFTLVRFTGSVKSICGCTTGGCRLCYAWLTAEADARYKLEKKAQLAAEAEAKALSCLGADKIKFTDLYEDVVLRIGEYLDLETCISLFMAAPSTFGPTQKLALRKIFAIELNGLNSKASDNLLIFLGKISETDLRKLGQLVRFSALVERMGYYNAKLSVVLADHTLRFNQPGAIKQSKALDKQFGHIRQNTYLVKKLQSAWREVSAKTQYNLNLYYYSLFNISRNGQTLHNIVNGQYGQVLYTLTRFIVREVTEHGGCYEDPLVQLGVICERIPLKNLVGLMHAIYESIYCFTHENFDTKQNQKAAMKKYFSLIEAMDSIHAYVLSKLENIKELAKYLLSKVPIERAIGISAWSLPVAERETYVRIRWPHVVNNYGLADENFKLYVFAKKHYISLREDGILSF